MARDYQTLRRRPARDAGAIAQAASDGDRLAAATMQRYFERFGRALSVVINILDPDAIVLGGGLSNIAQLLYPGPGKSCTILIQLMSCVPLSCRTGTAIPLECGVLPGCGWPGNEFGSRESSATSKTITGNNKKNGEIEILPGPSSKTNNLRNPMRHARVYNFLVLLVVSTAVPAKDLVLTSPPRESEQKAQEIFQPIAEYLTRVLKRPVVFKYSDNWLTYQSEMQKDLYDIVFDGPHFNSYRVAKYQHTPLVKLPGKSIFVIIAKKGNERINKLEDINGRLLCSPAPPNLAALVALSQYTNPARQPLLVNTKGFPQTYDAFMKDQCAAAVMLINIFEKLDKETKSAKVIFESKGLPNQAISASPRIDATERARLMEMLLSDAGKQATAKLREEYNGQDFIPANVQEYLGHAELLKDTWGFQLLK